MTTLAQSLYLRRDKSYFSEVALLMSSERQTLDNSTSYRHPCIITLEAQQQYGLKVTGIRQPKKHMADHEEHPKYPKSVSCFVCLVIDSIPKEIEVII